MSRGAKRAKEQRVKKRNKIRDGERKEDARERGDREGENGEQLRRERHECI